MQNISHFDYKKKGLSFWSIGDSLLTSCFSISRRFRGGLEVPKFRPYVFLRAFLLDLHCSVTRFFAALYEKKSQDLRQASNPDRMGSCVQREPFGPVKERYLEISHLCMKKKKNGFGV